MSEISSSHRVEVVPVVLEKHPNADSLSIVQVFGYTVVVKTDDWVGKDKGAYIPPDSIVPDKPEFEFLNGHRRIKAHKFRGIMSQGLLWPVSDEYNIGDEISSQLGIEHYEPPETGLSTYGDIEQGPYEGIVNVVYDLEAWYRYPHIFEDGEQVIISEKLHGCFPLDTRITMFDGSKKTIKNIKENDIILGVNNHGNIVQQKVLKTYKNGKTKIWVKATGKRRSAGRGSNFFSIKATPEHKFYCSNSECANKYKKLSEFKVGDKILYIRSELDLIPIHKQILLGKLLGDGHLHQIKNSAAITWTNCKSDSDYFYWTKNALGKLAELSVKNGRGGFENSQDNLSCNTHFNYQIKKYFSSFYKNKIKIVPDWIYNEITPISMAFWYMDDGSLGSSPGQENTANFAVCGFSELDCSILLFCFQKFGIKANYFKDSNGYSRIRLNSDEAEKFFLLVAPYIPKSMQRKLPERYRGHEGWIPNGQINYKPILVELEIDSIVELKENRMRYDLETENHNYFANSILVHNCNWRGTFYNNRMWVGSRRQWKKENKNTVWWKVLEQNPWIEEFCRENEGQFLYGEVYGWIQNLRYGHNRNEFSFKAFDILDPQGLKWMNAWDFYHTSFYKLNQTDGSNDEIKIQRVPLIYEGAYSEEKVRELISGKSLIADHMREGIVIRPFCERWNQEIGRVHLKAVSAEYLSKEK